MALRSLLRLVALEVAATTGSDAIDTRTTTVPSPVVIPEAAAT